MMLDLGLPEFRFEGACRDSDPDLHFPEGTQGPAARQIVEAKQVCAGCSVIEECRRYGMAQEFGIWGGLTEEERREMRAREITQAAEQRRIAALDSYRDQVREGRAA